MKQNENFPYVSVDTKHSEDRKKGIVDRVSDMRLDVEPVFRLEYNIPFSHVIFFDNSDFHYGGQGFEYKRATLALDIESKFYNAIVGIGGDFFDNANKKSKTNIYGMRLSPSDAKKGASDLLKKYKDNISFWLGGNHDAKWGDRNDEDYGPGEGLAEELDIPYAEYSLVYSIPVLTPNGNKIKKMNVCMKHKVENPESFIKYMLNRGIVPDIMIAEHTHSGDEGMYVVDVPIFEKNKNLMGYEKHPIYVFTGKSMQNGNTAFAGGSLFDQKTNAKGLLLSWKKNIAYSANDVTQPKYIPEPNPFNVLHKTEDKIGLRCQMLLDEYERPDITKFKEELENKTFGEIATQLDNISSYSTQEMLNFLAAHEVDKVEDCDEEGTENAK